MKGTIFLTVSALVYTFTTTILFFKKDTVNKLENRIFKKLLVMTIFSMIFELIIIPVSEIPGLNILIPRFFFVCILLWLAIFFMYSFAITTFDERIEEEKNIKKYLPIHIIFIIINFILCVLVLVLPIEFISEGDNKFITGPAANVLFITLAVYLIVMIILVLSHIKKIHKKGYIPIISLIILLIVEGIVQKIYPEMLLANGVFGFIIYLMYHTIENPDVKMINELELAKNQAEKANRAKTDFLSSMSHEIRTPLNAIVGLSEVIKTSTDIDEIHEDANDVVMASQNLLEIVNGILDISKIEADKMEIVEVSYNPIEVFNELKKLTEIRIGEKEIELRSDFAPDIPSILYGDKGKVKQIITNILTNAVKYTEKGYIDFNVNCINEKDTCKLQITISDTGRGIKEDQMDKLFTKFNRLEEDRNTTIEGTGLGLAITKSLTEMMGGKIIVHSTYGEGSKFTILISQKIQTEGLDQVKETKEVNVTFDDKKVLVVDDNKLNLKVATKLLKEYNLDIEEAISGFECINKLKNNNHYDIILMDIMMPKMSGVETLKRLKEIENFNIPVVALTADAMSGKSNKYIEVGFNDYLSKPIDKEELKKVLNKCLNGNIEIKEEKITEEDSSKPKILQITDEDIEMLNKKLAEDSAKQKELEEREKNNN